MVDLVARLAQLACAYSYGLLRLGAKSLEAPDLARDPELRKLFTYYPTSSLYRAAGRVRQLPPGRAVSGNLHEIERLILGRRGGSAVCRP